MRQPEALLTRIALTIARRFDGVFAAETVAEYVRDAYRLLAADAVSTTHLPVLAERFAGQRLTALAQAQGLAAKAVPEVLFVCTRNVGRSQMAAALLAHHAAGRVHVRTAGTAPAAHLDTVVVRALAEIGLDPAEEFPKPLTDEVIRAADIVITMGCGDACPVHPGKRYQDWLLTAPEGQPIERVRRIRDHIDERVRELLAELDITATPLT
ncbi:three-helix bundle dimerization domain-containing protein [Actinocorallia sp. API 0066]|uniref:arsenate reductase/protein-tyrosine-phosphatase family protein n=1 Tax=Actinocorallia sp. API 0066 TaxID=2896846 RepID=UPI0021071A05|nr:arsenate reductase ArsC [Actinocorallia sp. API 0066]